MDSPKLFLPDGCLTPTAMRKYLKGGLPEPERASIHAHLQTCTMCAESIKGYEGVSHLSGFSKQQNTLRNTYYNRRKRHTEVKFMSGTFAKFLVLVLVLILLLFIYLSILR